MKIIINTASTFKGGGVQVARSFIEECCDFKEHEYHIILGKTLSKLVNTEEYPSNFTFYDIGYRPATRVLSLKPHDQEFKEIEQKVKADVVFTTSGPAYWRPNAPHLVGFNLPHYIYRDSPYFKQIPMYKRLKWDLKGQVIKYFFLRDADAYVVQTDDVNLRLKRWIQRDQVFTVTNTYSRHYQDPKKVADKLPEKKKDEYRFLSLSAWYPHKNLKIIPRVIDLLPERIKKRVTFVLTLPEEAFSNNFSKEYEGTILNIGPVKPDEGPSLYEECDALFLPTLLECFSASYAEAMKMKRPIVTSDLGFAHTVCGEAALYADPINPHEISKKIVELIENPKLQEELIKNGLDQQGKLATARQRAEQYLRICRNLVNGQY